MHSLMQNCLAHRKLQQFDEQQESILSEQCKIILKFFLKKLKGTPEECQVS